MPPEREIPSGKIQVGVALCGPGPIPRRQWILILVLAGGWTALNVPKPPHIDDAAYAYNARRLAEQPLDPYGFAILWYDVPEPANEVLAPPVFPASWALAVRLCGDRAWLCKGFLFGWPLLCTWALACLLRRFARGLEAPLLLMSVFSPALLPSLNLMLDVPALALVLTAVELFLRGCEHDSLAHAVGAAIIAGLAMQTKYTGLLAPAVMTAAACLYRRWRLILPAMLIPAGMFLSWELLTAILYGQSHFLHAYRGKGASPLLRLSLAGALGGQLGGLLPAVTLVGLITLGMSGRRVLLGTLVIASSYAVIALCGTSEAEMPPRPRTEDIVNGCLATMSGITLALVVWRVWRSDALFEQRRDTKLLCVWLLLETLAYFLLSPFGAVRRVLAIIMLLTLLVGRLAARSCLASWQRRGIWIVAAGGAALGVGFALLDWREAQVRADAVELAVAWVQQHGGGRIWYLGHWGFQYAAEKAGMQAVIAEDEPRRSDIPFPDPSHLDAGDWIVVPDEQQVHRPALALDSTLTTPICWLALADPIPFRTVRTYYSGRAPLQGKGGPRLSVTIYRVQFPCIVVGTSPHPS